MDSRQDYDTPDYFIYEYHLISNFASVAGNAAGEFYTPSEVSQLMSEIVAPHLAGREEINIYDPYKWLPPVDSYYKLWPAAMGNPNDIKYYAQELKENTYNTHEPRPRARVYCRTIS